MSAPTVEIESRGAVTLVTLDRPEGSSTLSLQIAMDLLAASSFGALESHRVLESQTIAARAASCAARGACA